MRLQYNQLQNAFSQKKFSAYIVDPGTPQLCDLVRNAVATEHVVVAVINEPLCGEYTATGDAVWSQGTVGYVGQNALYDSISRFWTHFAAENKTKPINVLSVTGVETEGTTQAWLKAQQAAVATASNIKIAGTIYTDYTAPTTLKDVESYLQGHPNIQAIMSSYTGITEVWCPLWPLLI